MGQEKQARRVVRSVMSVLYDRSGFDDWWDGIDEDDQKEIKAEIVAEVMKLGSCEVDHWSGHCFTCSHKYEFVPHQCFVDEPKLIKLADIQERDNVDKVLASTVVNRIVFFCTDIDTRCEIVCRDGTVCTGKGSSDRDALYDAVTDLSRHMWSKF